MTRFVRRTLAPLLAGALAAGVVVAVADASDVLRFSGELAQSGVDVTTDSTTPLAELDLDKLVEQPSKFDFDSVKVDLGSVGDYFGLYEWSDEAVDPVDVAADLELMVPDAVDPDGEGPVVTGAHAAETYLLNDDCNPLMALPIRKQAKYTVRARILRPDLAGIAAATPAEPGSATALAVETDPIGISHVLPLESVVDVATVTVSEIDLDLIRAHPARLLNDLVAGDPNLVENAPPGSTPDAFGTTEFFGAAWLSCLIAAAEEGTAPVPQTVNGHMAFGLLQDHPDRDPVDATVPDIDTVAWVEEGLEFRVESTFLDVSDNLSIDFSVDLDTQTWLLHFADSVEPALDISGRLISRAADPLELLFREAFSAPSGLEFGDDLHGTSDAVSTSVRNIEAPPFVERLEQAASGSAAVPAVPTPPAPPTEGTAGLGSADQILRVRARGVLPEGASVTNARRRRSDPPNGFGISPEIATQVVAWTPGYLNSDPFREGWKKGFKRVDPGAVTLDELFVLGDGFSEAKAELQALDVVDLVFSNAEGTFRIDYLTPCYSVTLSALDSEGLLDFTVRLAREQKAARDAIFGSVTPPLVAPVDPRPPGDPFSPSLEDLDRDYILGALKANAARIAEHAETTRAERAKQDSRRTALCDAPNLASHLSGFTLKDADGNGVDDQLAANDVAQAGATEPTTDTTTPATPTS